MIDGRITGILSHTSGSISELDTITGKLSNQKTLSAALTPAYLPDKYEGPYNVTPKTTSQVLETNKKYMTDDVTVYEIPYAETTNVYGTTVTIAS